jgi:hypothetical protein
VPPKDITELLHGWAAGDAGALQELLPLVYADLRQRAGAYMRRERRNHTLEPTALVHEAYLSSSTSAARRGRTAVSSSASRRR